MKVRALLSGAVMVAALGVPAGPQAEAKAQCTPGDRPETGVQGQVPVADEASNRSQQGYSCNIRAVASNDIGGRGGDWQLAWYGHCAYRSTPTDDGDAVAVLDVANPKHPKVTKILHERAWRGRGGTLGIHEGLHASVTRGVLVVPVGTLVSVYDLKHNCAAPKLTASVDLGNAPEPLKGDSAFPPDMGIHSGKLSADGTFYYANYVGGGLVSPTGPCITVVDLKDLTHPSLAGRFGNDFPCHDLELSDDGTRAYAGYYASGPGYEAAIVGVFTPVVQPAHAISGLRILDTSQIQQRRPNPQVRVLGELNGGRQHTETFARIGGRSYVIGGEEALCPGGNGRIVDVTDAAHPVQVAEVPLAVNQLENCATAKVDHEAASPLYLLGYMSHYISVDDRENATLAFFSWYNSGLRVFDVRDPRHPREVAYYNPPVGAGAKVSHDTSMTYTRYDPRTGQIWFGSLVRGFNVVELAPRLRPRGGRWSVPASTRPVIATGAARRTLPAGVATSAMVCRLSI